ncbi:MAG: family 10 glycosylhydrolase [Clostridia bacterium]|nr:family 10 glycosylhydrolase [Clostridia bacterium]
MSKKLKFKVLPVLFGAAVILLVAIIMLIVIISGGNERVKNGKDTAITSNDKINYIKQIIPDGEMKGIWIASVGNINYPSQKGLSADMLRNELDAIVAMCKENSLNTILFQVRPCSDALYSSSVFPSSVYVSGKQGIKPDGDFDSLEYLVNKAHENDIIVFAWVNPLRVTTSENTVLSPDNPASLHPEWCISYGDKVYYDPALPEVQALISKGVCEIVSGYSVDGIVFDDYFYPYPIDGIEFDDSASYSLYGKGKDKDEWRRSNINSIIKSCYEEIKKQRKDCLFGVSPFGIWSNDNGVNGGSNTRGLSAYSEIFCDALSWIDGGYIDFISPQIYWDFNSVAAPYAELVDWWKEKTENSGVALFISHGAYKASEWNSEEITRQIEYAKEKNCDGSIFYGYSAITSNENGVLDAIASAYDESNN